MDEEVKAVLRLSADPPRSCHDAKFGFYLHELPEHEAGDEYFQKLLPRLIRRELVLIGFKFFDVFTQRLEFVASRIVSWRTMNLTGYGAELQARH
jgi:hypothetical protein